MSPLWLSLLALVAQTASERQEIEDVDAFMEKVLLRRDTNWDDFYNYFTNERAELTIEGSVKGVPLQGYRREFLWFVKDGYLVRSPRSVDGVAISKEDRETSEDEWIEREKKREEKRRQRAVDLEGGPERDAFFGFEFEPGNYLFAGRDTFNGRDVVVVEYYPEKLFTDDDEEEEEDDPEEDAIEAAMNKVFLVTLLIDPTEHQIVKMTLDNYGFDFLPAKWLLQLETVEASIVMTKAFDEIWLPESIRAYGKVVTALGSLSLSFDSTFYDYAKAETGATFRFPPRGRETGASDKPKKKR